MVQWIDKNKDRTLTGMWFSLPMDHVQQPKEVVEIYEASTGQLISVSVRSLSGRYALDEMPNYPTTPGPHTFVVCTSDGKESAMTSWDICRAPIPLAQLDLSYERISKGLRIAQVFFAFDTPPRAADRVNNAYGQLKGTRNALGLHYLPLVCVLTSSQFVFSRADLVEVALGRLALKYLVPTDRSGTAQFMGEFITGEDAFFGRDKNREMTGLALLDRDRDSMFHLSVLPNPCQKDAGVTLARIFSGPQDEFLKMKRTLVWFCPHAPVPPED